MPLIFLLQELHSAILALGNTFKVSEWIQINIMDVGGEINENRKRIYGFTAEVLGFALAFVIVLCLVGVL